MTKITRSKSRFWHPLRFLKYLALGALLVFFTRIFIFDWQSMASPSMENTLLVGERLIINKLTFFFQAPARGDIVTFNMPNYEYSKNKLKNLWERYVGKIITPNYTIRSLEWVKRVIGVPGDELKGVLQDGKPVIYIKKAGQSEFEKLAEPYVNTYPLVATYKSDQINSFTYRSWDPNLPLDQQPFYQLTKDEIELGKLQAHIIYHEPAIKYSGTPYISQVDQQTQPWNKSELKDGIGILDEFEVRLGKDEYWLMGDNRLASYDSRAWGPVTGELICGKMMFRFGSVASK